jgi:cholesterol transport system auxiliary component
VTFRSPSRRQILRGLALAGVAAPLAGCASVMGALSVNDTYDLTAPEGVKVAGGTTAQILIADPQALNVLDSERVVTRSGPAEIRYLSGAQWTDRLPRLVQARLIQTFENSGRTRAVGKPGQGLAIDYQIVSDIRRFEYQVREKRALVEISVKLMNDRDGRVIGSRIFTGEVAYGGDSSSGIVGALDGALDRVLVGILRWTVAKI